MPSAVSTAPVVADASPLIALDHLGHLDLLRELFGTVLIPPAVAREASSLHTLPDFISVRALGQPVAARVLAASLGPGEREAMSLAIETSARWVILDDRPARRLAEALGMPVIGTLGVLTTAKRRGLLAAVRPCLDSLNDAGFRISVPLYERILAEAGETEDG